MQPISNEEVAQILKAAMPDAGIEVTGDGYQYRVRIVSNTFAGHNTMQRHKQIYALLNRPIAEGRLHALSLVTKTPEENR
jgi:acid stress-induced BolA-like protein IbaG/YrbA